MLSPFFRVRTTRALCVCACVLSLFASSSLFAADPPKKAAATGKPGGPLLTREELRTCMNNKARLHQQRDETVQVQGQLNADKADILREGDELKERLSTLDRTNKELVEKYVENNVAHDKRIDDYGARTAAYNAKVDALTADNEAYKKSCENRRFDEKDEIAIKNGK